MKIERAGIALWVLMVVGIVVSWATENKGIAVLPILSLDFLLMFKTRFTPAMMEYSDNCGTGRALP